MNVSNYSSSKCSIACFCILYIGISSVFPPLSGYLGIYDTMLKILSNVILLVIVYYNSSICFKNRKELLFTSFFILYSVSVPYLVGNGVVANRYMDLLFFLTAPLAFRLIRHTNNCEGIKKHIAIISFLSIVTFIRTLGALLANSYIARSIKSSGETTIQLKQSGVGGYEFVYFLVLIGIGCFYCFWNRKKLVYLFITISCFIFIVISNYMTAVLLITVGCMIAILSGRNSNQKIAASGIICFLLVSYKYIIGKFIDVLCVISPNGRIARLLTGNDISIVSSIYDEFIIDRLPTLKTSFDSLLSTYGIGVLFFSSDQLFSKLGQHSFVLDSLAIWGIIIGAFYLYLIFNFLSLPKCISIPYVLLLMLDNATTSIALAIYVIIPFMLDYESHMKEEKNNEEQKTSNTVKLSKGGKERRTIY